MENKTMTMVEFLTNVIAETRSEEMKSFAQARIDKIHADNEKRRTSQNSKQKENEVLKSNIVAMLTSKGCAMDSATVGVEMGISTSKASSMLRQLVEVGSVIKTENKVAKRGKVNFYSVATE